MNDSITTTTTIATTTTTTTNVIRLNNFTSDINESFDKIQPQCDYSLLFSHLPLSFQIDHLKYFTFSQQSSIIAKNDLQSQYQQQSAYKLCFAVFSLIFGLFYSLIGYRFLKLATFIIGFSLGSSIIYLILSEQKQLSLVENLVISLSIGVLFAFVALLVQYIGLFLLGITSSISIVTCILILIDLFYTNKSAWLCIGLLFLCATLVASFTLKFQKSLTIVNTSAIGCGLLLIAIDFFVENNLLIDYIYELYKVNGNSFNMYERQKALLKSSSDFLTTTTKTSILIDSTSSTSTTTTTKSTSSLSRSSNSYNLNNSTSTSGTVNGSSALALFLHLYSSAHARLCWYTWMIFGSYFLLLIISLLVQFLITGRHYDHRDSWQKLIKGSRKKKSANLEKIRLKSHLSDQSGSHHHHHHGRNRHNSNQNNNNNTLSRNTDTDTMTNHIDTLLLVESGENTLDRQNRMTLMNCTVTSSSDHPNSRVTGGSGNKHKKRSRNNDNFEVVAFEAINHEERSKKSKKSKSNNISSKSKNKTEAVLVTRVIDSNESSLTSNKQGKENLASVSTTSSTSSSSSTCQLLPKTQNTATTTTSSTTAGSSIEQQNAINPSAPPAPFAITQPTVPPAHAIAGALIPPPLPTSQPPPITSTLLSQSSSNSPSLINPLLNNPLPLKNISKLKHHRNSVNKDKDNVSANDKFRHFYQIRRNNGDVLSQDFMNNLQTKLSSSNLNNNNNGLILNEPQSTNSPKSQRSSSLSSSDKKKSKSKKF